MVLISGKRDNSKTQLLLRIIIFNLESNSFWNRIYNNYRDCQNVNTSSDSKSSIFITTLPTVFSLLHDCTNLKTEEMIDCSKSFLFPFISFSLERERIDIKFRIFSSVSLLLKSKLWQYSSVSASSTRIIINAKYITQIYF